MTTTDNDANCMAVSVIQVITHTPDVDQEMIASKWSTEGNTRNEPNKKKILSRSVKMCDKNVEHVAEPTTQIP